MVWCPVASFCIRHSTSPTHSGSSAEVGRQTATARPPAPWRGRSRPAAAGRRTMPPGSDPLCRQGRYHRGSAGPAGRLPLPAPSLDGNKPLGNVLPGRQVSKTGRSSGTQSRSCGAAPGISLFFACWLSTLTSPMVILPSLAVSRTLMQRSRVDLPFRTVRSPRRSRPCR